MRIAFVNTSRGWGGAEEQMLAMTRELERRGHAVITVARRGGPAHERFARDNHRVLPVARMGMAALAAPFRAATRARSERFDVIHCHRDHDLPLGKLLAIAARAPLLLTQHCLPNRPSALTYGLADRVVAVSEYIANGIRAKLPAISNRVSVIVNGIDPVMFSDPDRQFWQRHPLVGQRGPLLGVVGAFYKGQEELIAMLPRLRDVFPQLVLILIGEDNDRKVPLVELATRLGVAEAVVFAGRIPREQMKDALASLDLNVSAFRNEGFGLSVVEGLAVGTPFVGYRAGGYPEVVVDERAGCLVGGGTHLEEGILKMLSNHSISDDKRKEICQSIAARFTLERMVDTYEVTYRAMGGRA
ncbi:glycosyltransferase family 4 protein [Geobacter sp.]|uniref:glycosyltransferase family 4 protein n=1 Tax=Geobacter sp. TaxID=46610 RepID=UPI00262C5D70|nr:glycosyltransferase family 4 protein [Geobacter sp.]